MRHLQRFVYIFALNTFKLPTLCNRKYLLIQLGNIFPMSISRLESSLIYTSRGSRDIGSIVQLSDKETSIEQRRTSFTHGKIDFYFIQKCLFHLMFFSLKRIFHAEGKYSYTNKNLMHLYTFLLFLFIFIIILLLQLLLFYVYDSYVIRKRTLINYI